jgi:four helix bundle protein
VQFLRIAQGSLKEVETQALLSARIGYIPDEHAAGLLSRCERLGKRLVQYIRSLERPRAGE